MIAASIGIGSCTLAARRGQRGREQTVSRPTSRRSGGFVPLLVVGVIAFVLWSVFARPAAAPQNATATVAARVVAATEAADPALAGEAPAVAAVAEVAPTESASAASDAPAQSPTSTPKPARPTATPTRAPPAQIDGLPVITLDDLPPEALETLALIESDGPFPFSKDGSTFQNRERLLPRQANGYYREYTVITPGEDDRGARRIIGGDDGELYYTDDHYASFARIWQP
jgi:ribonuclease T1